MKLKLLLLGLMMPMFLAPATPVVADHTEAHRIVCQSVKEVDPTCGTEEKRLTGPDGLITRIAQVLVFIVGAAALIMIVVAAIMYAISSGNPERAKTAWQTILYAIIGIIVALLAQLIVVFVLNRVK